jgi:hypothetical protein
MSDVFNYMRKRYEGLEIIISEISVVEDISTEAKEHKVRADDDVIGKLCNFKIKYTESEKALYAQYGEHSKKANEARKSLEESIENRYKKLFYSAISYYHPMILNTTDDCGTVCEVFPINGLLKTAAKDCNGGEADPVDNTADHECVGDAPF